MESLDRSTLESIYRWMVRLRALDERMLTLQRQGRVGFYGSVTGQEAVPIAAAHAIDAGDWVFPALRESSVMLARGYSLARYVAQVFGNAGDGQKGRQMPSHMAAREVNVVSWSSCIGTQLPQAVGAAYAMKLRREPKIALAFLGDGATSTADFHYAMNFAAVYHAPVVFVCQNNHWSISMPTRAQTASETLAGKAVAYGMPGVQVDGNDAEAVFVAVREAAARARGGGGAGAGEEKCNHRGTETQSAETLRRDFREDKRAEAGAGAGAGAGAEAGGGPTLIEAVTYRMGAHSSSDDPTRYRDEREVEVWRGRDPIERLRVRLGVGEGEAEAMRRVAAEEALRVVNEVEALPAPDGATLFEGVYAAEPWNLFEQRASGRT